MAKKGNEINRQEASGTVTAGGYCYKYPHPAVTTDCVIITFYQRQLRVLLVRRGIEPYKGCWALPGGFLKMDESAEEGARRELKEETGYDATFVRQFHTFSAPDRDPRERVITVAFYALVKWQAVQGADDADEAAWIPLDSLPNLAFDHKEIISEAMRTLRREIHFDPVAFELLGDRFSMSELQSIYEAILGREFDRRNFAKKMQHLDVVTPASQADDAEDVKIDLQPFPEIEECCSAQACCEPMPMHYDADCIEDCECRAMPLPETDRKDVKPKKKKSRLQKLFSFNRDRYDELKDSDTFEF